MHTLMDFDPFVGGAALHCRNKILPIAQVQPSRAGVHMSLFPRCSWLYSVARHSSTETLVAKPGLPKLLGTLSGGSFIVSWPNTGSYTLQQNTDLRNTNGWTTSGYSTSTANGTVSINITSPTGTLFFRLKQ